MKEYYQDDLRNTSWLGEVVDIEDPDLIGRIRVRVFGKFDDLPNEVIPWAYPSSNITASSNTGGGFHSVPKLGSTVGIRFDNGNLYHPEYFYNQRISDEVKEEIKDSYTNSHVIIYDVITEDSLKIFFTEKKGLMLDYKGTQINIKPDKSIILQTASKKSIIEILDDGNLNIDETENITINCKNAKLTATDSIHLDCSKNASISLGARVTDAMILGDTFQAYYNTHTHTGNLGAITSPPVMPSTPNHLSKINKIQ